MVAGINWEESEGQSWDVPQASTPPSDVARCKPWLPVSPGTAHMGGRSIEVGGKGG